MQNLDVSKTFLYPSAYTEVSGRIAGVELENFMCHGHLKVDFETSDNNHFCIGGLNGSRFFSFVPHLVVKVHFFASLNIGLGGRGSNNDRGISIKSYSKEGRKVEQPDIGLDDDFESETVMEQDEDKENEADSMETDEGYGKRTEVGRLINNHPRISEDVFFCLGFAGDWS
ncbi:hypothetical protein Aduo_016405 [Ancylostoma duodenale]